MTDIFDIFDNDVDLGYDEVIIKNLEKSKYTYHRKFKLISDEIKKRTKKLNIRLRIIGIILVIVILLGLTNIVNTDKIGYILLIIYLIISRKMFNLKVKETRRKCWNIEDYLKREDWSAICKDEVLEKYYSFKDIESEEAQKYAEKYRIIGTLRSLHPKK